MDSGKSSPTKYGESAPREPGKSGSSYTAMAISDKQKQKQSQKTANLKYRTNSKVPWKCLESEFFFEGVEDTDPEPPNVQEVVFTNEGIALRQCSVLFNRKVNVGEITDEVHCWEAVFSISKMRDIVCQQYEVASWLFNAPPGSKKVLNVLRFKYTGEPHNEDKSQNRESTAAEDNTQALESADTMDADKEPNAAEFKLKLLCQEMAKVPSMEIGLAFKASTARFDKGAYFWMWPLVINLLVGRVYRTKDRDENKAGLNEWAEANKDRHERALLKKVTVDGEVGWSVKIKL